MYTKHFKNIKRMIKCELDSFISLSAFRQNTCQRLTHNDVFRTGKKWHIFQKISHKKWSCICCVSVKLICIYLNGPEYKIKSHGCTWDPTPNLGDAQSFVVTLHTNKSYVFWVHHRLIINAIIHQSVPFIILALKYLRSCLICVSN